MDSDNLPPFPEKEDLDSPKRNGRGHELRPSEPEIITIEERHLAPQPPEPPQPPLHILAALATVALDWIWFLIELPATISVAFLPSLLPLSLGLGGLSFAAVTLVQHFLAGEAWGKAVTKGLVMGIIAGVPYPVFGTIVGVPLAAWAGIREIQKLLPPKT